MVYFSNVETLTLPFFHKTQMQCNPFIMLCLGSIEMDGVTSDSCYKGTLLQRNYRKMTISWSFSYNFFLKIIGSHNITVLYPKVCYNEACEEHSGSAGRTLRLLVQNSPQDELLWCVLEHDTLSTA